MEGATHFIECWYEELSGKGVQNKTPLPIEQLESELSFNQRMGIITYAIIFIKPKK